MVDFRTGVNFRLGKEKDIYTPFLNYLIEQESKRTAVDCSFGQIEQIIGKQLPNSAYKHSPWWGNNPSHPLMKRVLKIGWKAMNLSLENKTITFYRGTKSGKSTYALDMVKELQKEKEFKIQRNNLLEQQTPDFTVDGQGIYFEHILDDFISQITKGKIEIYNEASVQYELAIFLREVIPKKYYKIQLERNVSYFKLEKKKFKKKEIDIVLFNSIKTRKFAIEIKYPLSEVPIQMYKFCEDIKFLEQLKESGFTDNFFLAITPRSNFWGDRGKTGTIYEKFRKEKELYGTIKNQIGDSKEEVTLKGRHKINWLTINDSTRYFVMRI